MKTKLFWIILIIVLVCLNWFDGAQAQDLSKLSAKDKAALMARFKPEVVSQGKAMAYQSAPIFEADSMLAVPDTFLKERPVMRREKPDNSPSGPQMTAFEDLRPFGTELFSGPREITPPNDIASASDYILGPGDNLIVALWGQVESEYALTIDREGKVFVPKLGELVAWGKPLGEFRGQVKRKFSEIYSNFQLSVSLGKVRSIRVYLTGEVGRPGAYTVSSLTSLFNALFLAGGPTEHGSMRLIRLMRNGKSVAEVDLYNFLLKGDNSSDVRLESGDAIFVPVAGPRVAIRGKIRREAIYELKGQQTAHDLIVLAGQAAADAHLDRVMLERISGRDAWEVLDLDLSLEQSESSPNMALEDGDRLTVFSVFELKTNMVAAFGLVRYPGYYERSDSTTIADLIERAQLQRYDVLMERACLFRRYDDQRREVIPINLTEATDTSFLNDLLLQDSDSLHVYSIKDVTWDRYVHIDGEIQKPGGYIYYDNMTIEDLIFLAGSFKRGASRMRAELARVDSLGEITLEPIDLNDVSQRQTVLQEDDRVYVRQLPYWQLHRTVTLEGEVAYPGEYVLASSDETLYDLIMRAGGTTGNAFPKGTIVDRPSIGRLLMRKQITSLLERSSPVVQDSLGNLQRRILFDYQPESMNRIVLDVDELLASKGSTGDLTLAPGDRIFVPAIPSGISVLGAVSSAGTIQFQAGKKAKYYVQRAGNFAGEADKGGVRLIGANGEVHAGNGTLGHKVQLGDIIVVPTKIKKERNFTRSFTTALTAVTGILTTVLLIDRL